MNLKWKRLLALLMSAAMLLSSVGLTEEIYPEPEMTIKSEATAEAQEAAETAEVSAEESWAIPEQVILPEVQPELKEQLVEAASHVTTLQELADEYGYEVEVLEEMLAAMGFELSETLTDEEAAQIEEALASGMGQGPTPTANPSNETTIWELAEKYGYEAEVLEEMLLAMGIELSETLTDEEVALIEEILASGMGLPTAEPTVPPTPTPSPLPTPEATAEPEDSNNSTYPYNNIGELLSKRGFTMEYLMLRTGLSEEELTALSPELLTELDNMIRGESHSWPYPTPTPTPTATPTVPPVEQTNAAALAAKYGIKASQLAKMCEMSVADVNALSPEALQVLEEALDLIVEEYDSVDELAKDMGFTVSALAEASGKSEQELRSMTPIQVMAIFVDYNVKTTFRYDNAYELADWYGLSLAEIGSLVGNTPDGILALQLHELEELDAKLSAMGVEPKLSITTAQQLADKYGMSVSELAEMLQVEKGYLLNLSPKAITELDAAMQEMGFEPDMEFKSAQEVAQKHGLTLRQISILTGYREDELLSMSPNRLKELDEFLTNKPEYMFKNADQLAQWFYISGDELAERANVSYDQLYRMTPEQLQELYEYLVANQDSANIDGFQIENGVLVGYTGEERNIVIPDGVTEIGAYAFRDSVVILTVEIPESVTSIGEYAFFNCRALYEIYIPDSVTSIGQYAFYGCSSMLSARLPSGMTVIPDYLFNGCSKLQQVNIPSGVTEIGEYAFYSARLTGVTLPAVLKKIGAHAFSGNRYLNNVKLPDGLESIGTRAFRDCKLTEMIIPDTVTYMGEAVFEYSLLEECKLPSNMTTIPDHTFAYSYNLDYVELPKNLQIIEQGAFSNCNSLTVVDLPSTVTRIERAAFWSCQGLEMVNIPDGVRYLDDEAFSFCNHYKLVLLIPKQDKFIEYCYRNEFMYYYNDRVSYIEYDPAKITLMAGEKHDPVMYVDFTDVDTITFTTSNKKVATVDSKGVITAKAGGTATITAKSKKGGAKATLTVTVKTAPSAVNLNKTSAEMSVGGTLTLKASIPANSATNFTWTSSNPGVAAVDANGVVTAKTLGETTVTVTTANGKKASCAITVRTAPTALHLDEAATLGVGQTLTLKPVIEPEYAFQGMSYASSDAGVVQVSSAGKLTAKKAGTAVITATTDNGLSREMTVTVLAAPTKVKLSAAKMTMGVGQSGKLKVSVSPEGAHAGVTYSSSNAKVVTVDKQGNVVANKTGSATITVKTYNGKKTTCKITVLKAPSSIKLSENELTLGVGEERKLTAALPKKTAASIDWNTGDANVVTIDNGRIAAVGVGTASITATAHNGESASCIVTVKAAPTRIELVEEKISLSVKQKGKIGVTLLNGDSTDCAGAYTFRSSNAKIVTVSASGALTAVKAGKATITVTSYVDGVSAECEVTVYPVPSKVKLASAKATLGAGETLQLNPTLTPANSLTDYTYTSSKSSVAKVDSSGLVTAVKPGSATITVKTHNGKKATCKITVKAAPTSLVLSAAELTLGVGQKGKLNASINKDSASALKVTVSDENIISRSGTTLTAKAVGTAIVTVETFNGLKKTCTVTVKSAPTELVIDPSEILLSVGQSSALNVDMLANGSADCAGELSYSSSSTKIVTVSASGKLTAKKAGTATITVRSHNEEVYAQCKVRVVAAPSKVTLNKTSAKLEVGQTLQLTAAVSPASSPAALTFTSSKPSVAMVNADGTVTAMKAGSATITVKTHNGKKATCKITVSAAS